MTKETALVLFNMAHPVDNETIPEMTSPKGHSRSQGHRQCHPSLDHLDFLS